MVSSNVRQVILVSPQTSCQCERMAGSGTCTWRPRSGSTTHLAILTLHANVVGGATLVHWSDVTFVAIIVVAVVIVVQCAVVVFVDYAVVICYPVALLSVVHHGLCHCCHGHHLLSPAIVICRPSSSSFVIPIWCCLVRSSNLVDNWSSTDLCCYD